MKSIGRDQSHEKEKGCSSSQLTSKRRFIKFDKTVTEVENPGQAGWIQNDRNLRKGKKVFKLKGFGKQKARSRSHFWNWSVSIFLFFRGIPKYLYDVHFSTFLGKFKSFSLKSFCLFLV